MFTRSARRHLTAPLRKLLPTTRQLIPRSQSRFTSTQAPSDRGSLDHKTFYKTFGRPIAKVFLMAIFTYQLAYYFWVRLEQDEVRAEMQATISDLEARIDSLENAKKEQKKR